MGMEGKGMRGGVLVGGRGEGERGAGHDACSMYIGMCGVGAKDKEM